MPGILKFRQPQQVAVVVDDVSDEGIVARMVRDVQRVFRHIIGGWRVSVRASARGCWRLELSGASGRHVWVFAAPARTLSAAVVEKLEVFFRDTCPARRLHARV
ncbi:MAG TPA: hypothetical protein VFI56_07725 [Vicinamibacterales bacterium]|nr:hypothetical protein [Vicinamibacterales bacterium]